MANNNYHKLHKSLLRYPEEIRRYQHHITLITVYLNLNEAPKAFKIKVLRETFPDKTGSATRVMEERAKTFANIL